MEVKDELEEWIKINEKLQSKLNEFNLLKEEKNKLVEMCKESGINEALLDKMKDSIYKCKVLAKEINKLKKEASRLRKSVQ